MHHVTKKVVYCNFSINIRFSGAWGGVMFKALRYYSDGAGIDSRWCH
jgi:hypothetical protein